MAIRSEPSFFHNSVIFANFGVTKIFSRTLKGMSARISSRETLTILAMALDWLEYVVRQLLSRSTYCWYNTE